jgi:hypothetical protein
MGNFASTRRDFLKGGALVVGFAITARLSPVFAQAGAAKPVASDEVDSFVRSEHSSRRPGEGRDPGFRHSKLFE